jgi:hypothetical protein
MSHDQPSQQQLTTPQSALNNSHHHDSHNLQQNSELNSQNNGSFVRQNRQSSGVPPLAAHDMNVVGAGNGSMGDATFMDENKQQESNVVSILLGLGQQG